MNYLQESGRPAYIGWVERLMHELALDRMLSAMELQGLSRSVLLIDDDEQIAGSLRKYLIRRGCDTESVRERKSAAEILGSRRFDLILLDPYLTGEAADPASLLALVRERQALATIVLLTAYLSSELGTKALEAGVRAIITKPKPVRELGEFALGFLDSPDLP